STNGTYSVTVISSEASAQSGPALLRVIPPGSVIAWGANDSGQTNVPAGLDGVIAIAAGWERGLALINNGTVVGWGRNTQIPADWTNVAAIAAYQFNLALKKDEAL